MYNIQEKQYYNNQEIIKLNNIKKSQYYNGIKLL